MALSAIALCSRALLKIGTNTIASFEEGTVESEVAANLYPGIRDSLLSAYPWSFATARRSPPRIAAPPRADYSHAFQLPPDFLRALSAGVGSESRGIDYRIIGRHLHSNSEQVMLNYIFRPQERDFPPFFDQVLIARAAAEFAIPLTENVSRSEAMARAAEEEFRRARLIDAQQDTPQAINDFTLINVRD